MLPLILSLTLVGAFSAGSLYAFWRFKRRRLGFCCISTESVAYDRRKHGHVLDWNKHSLLVNGQPLQLFSGEFHYWRLPDRARWESILQQYKAAGLNCIRIYFHWGFHSPAEGVYHFDGNRDIVYLLQLCQKLRLFVLAAPGPYICAETSAGGYPFWLLPKTVQIRHSLRLMHRDWDPKFAYYCLEWWQQILTVLRPFQITENKDGVILGLQIENEYFENFPVPLGVHDEMRVLCKTARDLGFSVPFYTNDGIEVGSFVPRKSKNATDAFGIDLYGFDKYVIFVPISHPMVNIFGGEKHKHIENWKPWTPKEFTSSVDKLEKTVRGFGGGAAESPIFIPELQGGWFNHYSLEHTYDDLYRYYGETYTKTIFDTVLAQGCQTLSFYMFYGGTNWATIGDPDVYTSYDYSACVREFGFLSGRGRKLRLGIAFARSFRSDLAKTEAMDAPIRLSKDLLCRVRKSLTSDTQFYILRNFTDDANYTVPVTSKLVLKGRLPFKQSFIVPANYTTPQGIKLLFSTVPIYYKVKLGSAEVWVVQSDKTISGQLAFSGKLDVRGMPVEQEFVDQNTVLTLSKSSGWVQISNGNGNVYLVALSEYDLYTFNPIWEEGWFFGSSGFRVAFWGCTDIHFDAKTGVIDVGAAQDESNVFVLAVTCPAGFSLAEGAFNGCPFVFRKSVGRPLLGSSSTLSSYDVSAPVLVHWKQRQTNFDNYPWRFLPLQRAAHHKIIPGVDLPYLAYSSGHVFYKIDFRLKGRNVSVDVNMRHRVTLFLNGIAIGGHMTYSLHILRPGAKFGPDRSHGAQRYTLPVKLLQDNNSLVIMVENFGYNRQAFMFNDIRNPRGLLDAHIIPGSQSAVHDVTCHVAGVPTHMLPNVFETSGFPDENAGFETSFEPQSEKGVVSLPVPVSYRPVWYSATFDVKTPSHYKCPWRLVLEGYCSAYVWVNETLIARYYGNGDGPQHDFYIMDGLLKPVDNIIKMVCYDGRTGVSHEETLKVKICEWVFADDKTEEYWSGNMHPEGTSFILLKESFALE